MVSNKNKLRIGDYEQFIFSWGNVISCLWNYSDIASRQRVPTDKRNKRSFSARIIMFCSKDSWDVHMIRYLRDPKYVSSRFSFTYKLDSRSMSAKENYAFIFNAILREISSARDNRIMAPRHSRRSSFINTKLTKATQTTSWNKPSLDTKLLETTWEWLPVFSIIS